MAMQRIHDSIDQQFIANDVGTLQNIRFVASLVEFCFTTSHFRIFITVMADGSHYTAVQVDEMKYDINTAQSLKRVCSMLDERNRTVLLMQLVIVRAAIEM